MWKMSTFMKELRAHSSGLEDKITFAESRGTGLCPHGAARTPGPEEFRPCSFFLLFQKWICSPAAEKLVFADVLNQSSDGSLVILSHVQSLETALSWRSSVGAWLHPEAAVSCTDGAVALKFVQRSASPEHAAVHSGRTGIQIRTRPDPFPMVTLNLMY